MLKKRESVITVQNTPDTETNINYYQVSTAIASFDEKRQVYRVDFSMCNGERIGFVGDVAASAYSQYQKIVNKEND